ATYDSGRDRIVAFRGLQTWEFDGVSWAQMSPTVMPLVFAPIAYDAGRQRTVLYDGFLGNTWEWDGQNWTLVGTNGPNLVPAMLVYHAGRGTVMHFDAVVPPTGPASTDLWEWNGATWSLIQVANRPPDGSGRYR